MPNAVKHAGWFVLGAVVTTWLQGSRVHADPQPALDRQLTERMVRALEAQVHATEALTRATEKLHR